MTPGLEPSVKTYNDEFLDKKSKKIFCYYWEPPNKPRALVHINHGYTEHSMIYEDLAKELAKRNFFVFAHDHVGHGKSDGSRAHVNGLQHLEDDTQFHVEMMQKKFPGLPVFLIGHSMGGAVSILLALNRPKEYSGIALISPSILPNPETATPFRLSGRRATSTLSWNRRVMRLMRSVILHTSNHPGVPVASYRLFLARFTSALFPEMPIAYADYSLVSRDPEKVKLMNNDPLRHHGYFKARAAFSIIIAGSEIIQRKEQLDVPYLILHGDDDKVCHISGSEILHQHSSSKDKTFKVYQGAYHALHNESEGIGEDVYNRIVEWLEARA